MVSSVLVTNSSAPAAIGDALGAVPALAEMAKRSPGLAIYWTCPEVVGLFPIPYATQALYDYEPVAQSYDIQQVYAGFHHLGVSMPEAYARAMGIVLPDGPPMWPMGSALCGATQKIRPYVLISNYSRSDFGTGYKNWPAGRWLALVELLHEAGLQVGHICAADDAPLVDADFVLQGEPLGQVGLSMIDASASITIDNGMSWLAQAMQAPHVNLLSVNQTREWSWDPGPMAINLHNVHTTSAAQAFAAVMDLVERG